MDSRRPFAKVTMAKNAEIGVCYGRAGSNLPSSEAAVSLCKSNGIGAMRIYDLDEGILRAAHNSGMKLVVGVPNDPSQASYNVQSVGTNCSAAKQYVQQYVVPYASSINYVIVGNEISMDSPEAPLVGPAMENVLKALNDANLGGQIKVTTAISTSHVVDSFPPSNGRFDNPGFMGPVTDFLVRNGSPLFLNVYTYPAYYYDGAVSRAYASFTSPNPVVTDPNNGLQYYNLFDALVDATYAALSKVMSASPLSISNGNTPDIKTGETGSSTGLGPPKQDYSNGDGDAFNFAQTYYQKVTEHSKAGTPLRPGPMDIYLFEMFDEDNKPGGAVEKNFGIFYPNQTPKFQLNFNP